MKLFLFYICFVLCSTFCLLSIIVPLEHCITVLNVLLSWSSLIYLFSKFDGIPSLSWERDYCTNNKLKWQWEGTSVERFSLLFVPHWSCSNCHISLLTLYNGASTLQETPEGTDRTQFAMTWVKFPVLITQKTWNMKTGKILIQYDEL